MLARGAFKKYVSAIFLRKICMPEVCIEVMYVADKLAYLIIKAGLCIIETYACYW